jgi:hypothetical protein
MFNALFVWKHFQQGNQTVSLAPTAITSFAKVI